MKKSPLKRTGFKKRKVNLPDKPFWLIMALRGIHVHVGDIIISGCEVCKVKFPLTPAHRYARLHYRKIPELLWEFSDVLVLCSKCHLYYDTHKQEKEELFRRLRP